MLLMGHYLPLSAVKCRAHFYTHLVVVVDSYRPFIHLWNQFLKTKNNLRSQKSDERFPSLS